MAWPASVVTRKISFGSAVVLETGEDLSLTVATKANRALVSMGQGFRMESYIFTMTSGVAEEVVFDLPVTNQTGWMDAETRQPLTVGADVHSHLYTTTLTIKRGGEVLKSYTVGPYALPQGAGVLDGDTMLVKDPVSGITLTIPEAWQQVIDSANAIVTDLPGAMAQHASDGSAFNLALSSTIADAVAGVSSDVVTLVRPDHLRRFRSALGRARFSQTHVVIEGDSVVAGGDSGDEVPVTAAQKLKALIRGWASQVRAGISSLLGIDAGEGWVGLAGDEGRWSFTGAAPSPGAYGPVATGARLSAGNDATATGQDFRYVDFVGYTGGAVTHPPRIEIDDADVRPTALNADAKNGVVAAGKWAAIGTNTTITQPAPRRIRLTAVGTGTVRADFGDATGDFAVTAGEWLLFTVAAIAPAARQGGVSAYFYNDAGTQIGSEIPVNATSGAGTYAQSTGFVQVPAGATKLKPVLRGNTSMAAGEYIELESFDIIRVTRWAVTGGGSMYKLPTIDAGAGVHKIKILAPLANQADVSGMWLRKRNDAGVLVSRLAKSGTTTTDHVSNFAGAGPTEQQWLAQNEVQNAVAPVALRIIALGKNDFNGGAISPTTYRANLVTIATKAISAGECVLLMADARYTNDTGKPYPEEAFYAAARDIAETTDHVAFIDIAQSWGTNAQATAAGFMESAFGIHPNLAGHGDIARIVLDALTRQVTTPAT